MFFSPPGSSDPSAQLPLHTTSPRPKKNLKGILFDLAVIAFFVAAACLGRYGVGKALSLLEQSKPAVIGSDYKATESEPPALTKNRRQNEKLQQLKVDVTEKRIRLQHELDTRPRGLPSTDGDGAEDLTQSLREANKVLLLIELSQRVLEIERLSLPLSAGVAAMGEGQKAHAALTGRVGLTEQLALATRFVDDHAGQLAMFRNRVAGFRDMEARMEGWGVTLHEGYQEKMHGLQQLHDELEGLRSMMEEYRATMRSLGSEL